MYKNYLLWLVCAFTFINGVKAGCEGAWVLNSLNADKSIYPDSFFISTKNEYWAIYSLKDEADSAVSKVAVFGSATLKRGKLDLSIDQRVEKYKQWIYRNEIGFSIFEWYKLQNDSTLVSVDGVEYKRKPNHICHKKFKTAWKLYSSTFPEMYRLNDSLSFLKAGFQLSHGRFQGMEVAMARNSKNNRTISLYRITLNIYEGMFYDRGILKNKRTEGEIIGVTDTGLWVYNTLAVDTLREVDFYKLQNIEIIKYLPWRGITSISFLDPRVEFGLNPVGNILGSVSFVMCCVTAPCLSFDFNNHKIRRERLKKLEAISGAGLIAGMALASSQKYIELEFPGIQSGRHKWKLLKK